MIELIRLYMLKKPFMAHGRISRLQYSTVTWYGNLFWAFDVSWLLFKSNN